MNTCPALGAGVMDNIPKGQQLKLKEAQDDEI